MPLPRLRAALALSGLVLSAGAAGALAAPPGGPAPQVGSAAKEPWSLVEDRRLEDRLPTAEDRYAPALGCYVVEAPGQGFVTEVDGAVGVAEDRAAAAPLHFQPTRLGEYLLATNEGRDTRFEGATWDVRGYLAAGSGLPADPLTSAVLGAGSVVHADAPSEDAEWRLVAAGKDPDARDKPFLLQVPSRGSSLRVADGELSLVDDPAQATPLVLRHVPDDKAGDADLNGAACASWPDIDPGATGTPKPSGKGAAAPVRGFFDAHIHGMAFEFLGGELRCGRPWHEYGVEYALGSCDAEKNSPNRVLEVPLGGYGPDYTATYDPVGWPTFASWPKNRTLTHEQFYWRWLQRAHAGGLRLMTNLLVENTALCQQYPVKKNSCNEMDSVRLQAKRLYELQDYVDAHSGGPGEGWLRIVSTPAQARATIHDGRLAIMMGIEVSALFDCSEVLDVPNCTEEQVDDRLQEVYDMGVRQVQLVNKFDNALSGVTGDPGTTGYVVNAGNKYVTGHFWDMRTCTPETDGHDHEHAKDLQGSAVDRQQLSPADRTPEGAEGVDALAGRILDEYGTVTRTAVPVYGPGPHCNSRGLTDLGKHLIRSMMAKGMIFDPDHMSAKAQLEALDLVEDEIAPAERAAAAKQGRPARKPSVISSHTWANDIAYQRIYELDGVVAPYAFEPTKYVETWTQLRTWAEQQAPKGYDFGLGYGADTNGLGGQPPPRVDSKNPLQYRPEGFAAPIGDVRLRQHVSGLRTFDVTKEGVAMYGLFADWVQEVSLAAEAKRPGAGAQVVDDMLDGAETYLELWERAVYGVNECVTDQSSLQVEDLSALLGGNLEGFAEAVGQPTDRTDDVWTYCAEQDGETVVVDVAFDATGTAREVRPSTSDVVPTVPGHDHDGHAHDLVGSVAGTVGAGLPADGDLALGTLLVLGLTGLGAGTLTGRYRA